jgi:hypothetical protein
VPVQRKARAWEAFEALFAQTSHALADDFDSVFGRAFARAYEQALNETRDRRPTDDHAPRSPRRVAVLAASCSSPPPRRR